MPSQRVIVCGVGGSTRFGLPESRWDDTRVAVSGGERTLYELAFAAADAGHDVELRGYVCRSVFEELASATSAPPTVDLDLRPAAAGEVVIVPEGWADPERYLAVVGSEARAVLIQLAPLGMMGWTFDGTPTPAIDDAKLAVNVGTHEQQVAARVLGFESWTNSVALATRLAAEGVPCTWIGSGTPLEPPTATQSEYDVAIVGGNRWEHRNRIVCDALGALGHRVLVTETGTNADIIRQLSAARILVHLARAEGHSRLGIEARRVGTVPVMDRANANLAGPTEADGMVLVEDEDEAVVACVALLEDTTRLDQLAQAGRRFADSFVDWSSYVDRVDQAIRTPPDPAPPRPLRSLTAVVEEQRAVIRHDEQNQAATVVRTLEEDHAQHVAALEEQIHLIEEHRLAGVADRDRLTGELDALNAELAARNAEIDAMRATSTWRVRERVAHLPGSDRIRNLVRRRG